MAARRVERPPRFARPSTAPEGVGGRFDARTDYADSAETTQEVGAHEGLAQAGIDPQPAETRAEGRQLLVPVRMDGQGAEAAEGRRRTLHGLRLGRLGRL